MGIGFSKAGFSGVSMLHVVVFAMAFGAKESTGVLLPMLVVGDFCAVYLFGSKANWKQVWRVLPPALIGVLVGWQLMGSVDDRQFRWIVGGIILSLSAIQAIRMAKPNWFEGVPHHRGFAIVLGGLAGLTTMLANAAGPVVALYLLAVALPKWELIGTSVWVFLVLNLVKLPLSYQLGFIDSETLVVDLLFAPAIPVGILAGRWLVQRMDQTTFNAILLAFTVILAIRLVV